MICFKMSAFVDNFEQIWCRVTSFCCSAIFLFLEKVEWKGKRIHMFDNNFVYYD